MKPPPCHGENAEELSENAENQENKVQLVLGLSNKSPNLFR